MTWLVTKSSYVSLAIQMVWHWLTLEQCSCILVSNCYYKHVINFLYDCLNKLQNIRLLHALMTVHDVTNFVHKICKQLPHLIFKLNIMIMHIIKRKDLIFGVISQCLKAQQTLYLSLGYFRNSSLSALTHLYQIKRPLIMLKVFIRKLMQLFINISSGVYSTLSVGYCSISCSSGTCSP